MATGGMGSSEAQPSIDSDATGGMRISEAQPSIDSDALNENGSNPTHPADGPAAPVQYRLDPTQKFMNQQIRVNRYVFPILKYEPPPQDEPAPVDEPADAVPNPAGDG